jgi:hypothetical protein
MSEDGADDPLSDGAEIALLPARSGATAADNEGAIRFQRLEIEICDLASTHRAVRWPTPILVANPLRRSIRLSGARVKRPSSTASTIVTSGFSGGELKLLPEGSQFIPKPYDAALRPPAPRGLSLPCARRTVSPSLKCSFDLLQEGAPLLRLE